MNKKSIDRCDDDQWICFKIWKNNAKEEEECQRTNENGEFPANIDDDKSKWQLVIDIRLRMSINQLTCHNS